MSLVVVGGGELMGGEEGGEGLNILMPVHFCFYFDKKQTNKTKRNKIITIILCNLYRRETISFLTAGSCCEHLVDNINFAFQLR